MIRKLLLCAALMGGVASAQPPLDFELGEAYTVDGQYPYALARANIAIGPEVADTQLFVLPEAAVFFKGETSYWLRLQVLADGPLNTLFIEGQYGPMLGMEARAGIRFGLF